MLGPSKHADMRRHESSVPLPASINSLNNSTAYSSSSKTNSCPSCLEMSCNSQNTNVHYRTHKSSSLDSILSQTCPPQTLNSILSQTYPPQTLNSIPLKSTLIMSSQLPNKFFPLGFLKCGYYKISLLLHVVLHALPISSHPPSFITVTIPTILNHLITE